MIALANKNGALGDLGRVISNSEVLKQGQVYTITFDSGKFLMISSPSSLRSELARLMQNFGTIISVERALFSNRFAVSVSPTSNSTLSAWLNAFDYSWKSMGYTDAKPILTEDAATSSAPGGITQVLTDTAGGVSSAVSDTMWATIKPMLPWIIGGVIALIVLPPVVNNLFSARRP